MGDAVNYGSGPLDLVILPSNTPRVRQFLFSWPGSHSVLSTANPSTPPEPSDKFLNDGIAVYTDGSLPIVVRYRYMHLNVCPSYQN